MKVFDFDHTIYDGDSSIDFFVFCIQKYPIILLRIPKIMCAFLQYKLKKIEKKQFKQIFFSFLCDVDNPELLVKKFWDKYEKSIYKWFEERKNKNVVVISASPYFLLTEICKRKGIVYLCLYNGVKSLALRRNL